MDAPQLLPHSSNEAETTRLHALQRFQILDTLPEPAFDRLTRLAAHICSVPAAVINFIDAERQWSKSCSDGTQPDAIPRAVSFCAHTIHSNAVHVVPDTTADPRFVNNPFVTVPNGIRFYAGAPIWTHDGQAIGSLCVIDVVPRTLHPAQAAMLQELAAVVMDTLELRLQRAEASEIKFKTLFEVLPVGISITDPDGNLIETNAAAERLLGIPPDQQLQRQVDSLEWQGIGVDGTSLPPDQYARVRALGEQRRVADAEIGIVRPDGTTSWIYVTASPLPLPDYGAVIVYHDITERWQTEQALRASEEKYRGFVEQSADGFLLTDEQGYVIEFNHSLAEQVGLDPTDVLGQPIWDIHARLGAQRGSPDATGRIATLLQRALRTGQSPLLNQAVNVRYRRAGGDERTVQQTLFAIKTERGYRLGGVSRDVTHLHQAEQALRVSEERLSLVLQGSNDGLWDWNIATGEVVYSPRWAEMLGYTLDEIVPGFSAWERLVHPEDLPLALQALNDHLSGHTPQYMVEHRLRNQVGVWQWILVRGRVVARAPDGTPLRMAGTHTDLTERKQAEAERLAWERSLQHAQRLESLGVLAGGIAHDFNNLLTGILGHAELLRLDVLPASDMAASIDAIVADAQRAAALTNQMLAYSGRGKFVVAPVVLTALVRDMGELLRVLLPKQVRLHLDLSDALPAIAADVTQMRQVLLNLVTNAAEAMDAAGGEVTIATASEHLSAVALAKLPFGTERQPGHHVRLTVTDTGCGMDATTQTRMFDPFFTTKFTGRGLGLAAVQGIVRGHGGVVHVTSTPGGGTTFSIWFPSVHAEQLDAHDTPGHGRRTILVIDDEASVRSLLTRLLQRLGWDVQVAEHGPNGLALLDASADIAGVLVDLTMPGMSGDLVAQAIQAQHPDLPIMLMSGYDANTIADQYPHLRVAGFLHKPFTLADLRSGIERHFVSSPG